MYRPPSEAQQRAEEERIRQLTASVQPTVDAMNYERQLREQQGRNQLIQQSQIQREQEQAAINVAYQQMVSKQLAFQEEQNTKAEVARIIRLGQRDAQEKVNQQARLLNIPPPKVAPLSLAQAKAQINENRVAELRARAQQNNNNNLSRTNANNVSQLNEGKELFNRLKGMSFNDPSPEKRKLAKEEMERMGPELEALNREITQNENARIEGLREPPAQVQDIIGPAKQRAYDDAYAQFQTQIQAHAQQHQQDRGTAQQQYQQERNRAQQQYRGMLNTTENQLNRQRQMMQQGQSPIGLNPELMRMLHQQGGHENVQYVPSAQQRDPYEHILRNFNPEMFNPDYYPEES